MGDSVFSASKVEFVKPNILHIHTDSMDGRVMGCMGHPAAHTPNLDRMASEGVLFRNAYCNNPICCPSRASMRSGLYTHNCEAWNNYKGLSDDDPTYDTHLARAGVHLQNIGRMDYLSGAHTIRARVDAWTRTANIMRPAYREPAPRIIEEPERRVAAGDWRHVDATVDWLRERAGRRETQPFKLYVGFCAPHPPFTTSRAYLDLIDESAVTVPPPDDSSHPVMRYQQHHKNWMHGWSDDAVRQVRRIYYAMVAETDAMVGSILDALAESGLADSTVVVFSSDHGELAMEHGQYYKMAPYEESVRVPLIARGPDVQRAAVVDTPVSLVDLFPTFLDLAGQEHPPGLDGFSIAALLAGNAAGHPDWIMSEYHDVTCNATWFLLRQGDWKYVHYVGYEPQLFHLGDDPDEIVDRARTEPALVREMDAALRAVVDPEEVDARVTAYERRCFRRWREDELAAGTYRDTMARIFSGWDDVPEEEIVPWTDEEEEKLSAWLDG